MRKSRSQILLEKSTAAMVSAIEVYNKPDHRYREETFAILALNGWELLLKAKVLLDNNNQAASIYRREPRRLASGGLSTRLYVGRNRSGNPSTLGLGKVLGLLQAGGTLPEPVRRNIEALMEVRDNAVHYVNRETGLSQHVQELGTASLQSYAHLAREWFDEDLSRFDFFLMPLAFFRDFRVATAVHINAEERNLEAYLAGVRDDEDQDGEHAVRLTVDIQLRRRNDAGAPAVRITNDPSAPAVVLTEEDIRHRYPWDYQELCGRLRARYTDFKVNQQFHQIRKPLLEDDRYAKRRLLDLDNPGGIKKDFYSPNIVQVFDQHYELA